MTGGAERVAHITPPPASVPWLKHTSWYMSDHYICLQYLLFLSLIFRLCWLWGNWELVWDIIRGKFAKQVLSVFFLPNEVISYVYKVRASVLSLWTCNIMRWFSLESPVVERKYIFTRFKVENDLSLTALVAGMTSNSFPRVEISLNSFLRELSRDCKKVTKSLTSNSEVSNPTDSAVCGKSKRCSLHLKDILKLLVVFGRAKIRFRSFTQFQIAQKNNST